MINNQKIFYQLCCISFFFISLYSCQTNKETNISGGNYMKVTSSAFSEGTMIPNKFTCDDINISPPLEWSQVPEGTKTFAIICNDPDAPAGDWVHWVLYNLPPNISEFKENVPKVEILSNGAIQGKNDFGRIGYGGPCPPGGTHRYYFRVYALTKELYVKAGITKTELLKAMEGSILAEGELMGRYKRN
jgi:Raf kinase inhibitor-like YbhB/YbcL family protein